MLHNRPLFSQPPNKTNKQTKKKNRHTEKHYEAYWVLQAKRQSQCLHMKCRKLSNLNSKNDLPITLNNAQMRKTKHNTLSNQISPLFI